MKCITSSTTTSYNDNNNKCYCYYYYYYLKVFSNDQLTSVIINFHIK